ncbi:MAG: metallophosphoesterase [Clostridia bacterium]|nr:metallophosphoesterase [Clostridia bacterium]
MKKQMQRMMKTVIALVLVAMMLCMGVVDAFATTAQEHSDDHALDDHLILYSSFNDSNANDESGKGHNGAAVGNVQYADGIDGKAISITGQANAGNDAAASIYVDYGRSNTIIPDTEDFTVSLFFRSTGEMHSEMVLLSNKDYTRGVYKGFALVGKEARNPSYPRLNISNGSNNKNVYTSLVADDGKWHLLTGTYDRDGYMVFYIDGVSVGMDDISGYPGTIDAGYNLILGADGTGMYGANNCLLDELRVYDKALTADEVAQLYESTAAPKILAETRLKHMLTSVQSVIPSILYPQESINEMITMISSALNQLDTVSDDECLVLLSNCQAAYDRFLKGAAPLASFHWVSDVHVPYYNDGYVTALQNMASINAASNIGLIITGDITNGGSAAQFETFYQLTKENSPVSAANTAIILGNHDVRKSNSPSTPDQYDPSTSNWATAKGLYLQHNAEYMPSTDTVYHVKEIGGYTFIMLNTEMDLRDASYMSREQLAWLEETLAAAYEKDPNKPIFIVHHQPLYDTHYDSNRQRTFLMEGMTEEESNNKIKEVLAKYPTSIFMSGHLHNGYASIRGIVRPFGAAVEIPAFDDGGNSYEVQIYSDCVVFRAINYVTGEYAPAYDMTIQIGENNVSQVYQKAQKVLAESGKYDASAIANIQTLSNTLHGLITVSYTTVDSLNNFYKAPQHAEINATAQRLKAALNNLRGSVSAGGTVKLFAGEILQLTVAGATAWRSGNESIVTVDASGKLTALKKGETTVTVTTASGEITCNVTVTVDTSAIADAIYTANTLKTNVTAQSTVCGAGEGKLYVSPAELQALDTAITAAQAELTAVTTAAEAANAAKAMNDALDAFRDVIKVAVAHEGLYACSTKCKYNCGTDVDHVACVGVIACQDRICKYCEETVEPVVCKGKFECSDICQYGCGRSVEPKPHEIEEDGVMCKYGCGKLMGDPTASLVDADGVTTYYASLEEAVTAATSGSTVTLLQNIGSEQDPLQLTGIWLAVNATDVTLDGGDHTVIANSTAVHFNDAMIKARDASGGFVLKNITIDVTYPEDAYAETPIINSGGPATITVENCKLTTNKIGFYSRNQRADVTITNTEIHAGNNAYMSHDKNQYTYTATLTNCKLYSTTAPAIQARMETKLILNDTVVQGGNGVDIDCSYGSYANAVEINGDTVLTNGIIAIKAPTSVSFGTAEKPFTGKQIIRESGNNYYLYETLAEALAAGATKEELCTYSKETADAIKAEGYFVIANGTRYTIGEPGASLTVDGTTTPYATLQDAIYAANTGNGGTITMLANADYGITGAVEIKHNTTIDGQGKYTITAKITTDFYRPVAGITFTLRNLNMTATSVNGSGQPAPDDLGIVWLPDVDGTIVNVETCNITSTNDVALQAYVNDNGGYIIKNSTIFGGRVAIRFNNSDHRVEATNSQIHGGEYAVWTKKGAAMNATFTDCTITSGIYVTGTAKVTLAGKTVLDPTLIKTLYPNAGYNGFEYAMQLTNGSNVLTVTGNAKIMGKVKVDAGTVNIGAEGAAYTGTQIIRKSGNDYYFYDLGNDLELQVGDCTYSAATADAIKARYYTVSEASGVYTVTGKIDVSPLVNAINAAKNAKANIVTAEKACMAGAGNRYVSAAQMQALDAAIATAEERLAAIRDSAQVAPAANALNTAVATFEAAIKTGVAHEGWFDCSATCKACGTTITPKKSHDGQYACSTTCIFCNVANTVTDAVEHDGQYDCSTTCKYGCGTEMTDAKTCVGTVPCVDTTCKWCGEAVTPIAHDMVTDAAKAPTCTETGLTEGAHCSRCDTATTAQQTVAATGHKYDNDSDASCNVCGAERVVNSNANTNENNASNNGEAPEKQGLSGGAIAGIVIGAVVVLGGGGFALFWFVIRKKKA